MSSDSGAFYCSRLRPARLVTYLEALETAEEEPHVDHFTVLPPRDGDVGDAESDLEDVPDDLEKEDGFEAAGERAIFTKRRSGGIMAAMRLFWQSRIREAQTRFLYCA